MSDKTKLLVITFFLLFLGFGIAGLVLSAAVWKWSFNNVLWATAAGAVVGIFLWVAIRGTLSGDK